MFIVNFQERSVFIHLYMGAAWPRMIVWYFTYNFIQMMLCFSHQGLYHTKVSYLSFAPDYFTKRSAISLSLSKTSPCGYITLLASHTAISVNPCPNRLYYSKSGPYRQDILNCLINESILYWINDQRINTISLLPIAINLSFAKRQR
jgi:hypothetical protein